MSFDDMVKQMQDVLDGGGAFCIDCGKIFDSVIDARKHDLAEHYDYCLAQCNGDKELLKEWVKNGHENKQYWL